MNVNQIFNMVLHFLVKPAVNSGVRAGIEKWGKGKDGEESPDPQAKKQAKRAEQAFNIGKRFGRF